MIKTNLIGFFLELRTGLRSVSREIRLKHLIPMKACPERPQLKRIFWYESEFNNAKNDFRLCYGTFGERKQKWHHEKFQVRNFLMSYGMSHTVWLIPHELCGLLFTIISVPLLNMTSAAPVSLCGVEFVVTKERREKRAQRESCLKGYRHYII